MSPAAMPFSSGTGGSAKPGHAVLASLVIANNSGSAEKCQVTLVILPVARKELPGRTLAYLATRCADQKFHGIWRAECMESPGSQRDRNGIARDRQCCCPGAQLFQPNLVAKTVRRFRAIPLRFRAIPAILHRLRCKCRSSPLHLALGL